MKRGDNPTYAPPQHQYQYHHDALLPNLCLCSPSFLNHPASPLLDAIGLVFLPHSHPKPRGSPLLRCHVGDGTGLSHVH